MKKSRLTLTVTAAIAAAAILAGGAQARDQIRIVGSSTVFPFSTAVAEEFGRTSDFPTPVVESTGSGGGMRLFCEGVGPDHPDITNSSRRIKSSEFETCTANGITITEVKVGFDGIVLANARESEQMAVTKEQIFLALAREVPVNGVMVENPYATWAEIDPSLPNVRIEVLGPPPTSGTRDAFVELVMLEACESFPEIAAMEEDAMEEACASIREDGYFIEAGENDNLIVQKLQSTPTAFGIFGFSFLDQNSDVLQGSNVNGVDPTFDNIASGEYGVSRSLYFYVKQEHVGVIPGIAEFVAAFTAESAWGPEGYLADKGLIPLPEAERADMAAQANGMTPLAM